MEFALQFVTHLCNHYSVPDLVGLARLGHERGFAQIWVNDNVRYRGQLIVLTAIAAQVPVRIGTAILVPYFHQPLDLAGSLGALSELTDGREVCVGIAQGDLGQAPQHVEIAKPVAMVRETATFLRRALAGEEVAYGDPALLGSAASRHLPGHKGGRAFAVAALALLTEAALAAADAFHLRRASRSIS